MSEADDRMPEGCMTQTSCLNHGCRGACLPEGAAIAQQPLTNRAVRDMLADTREVFSAADSETPQIVRDVIEYVDSWFQVNHDKRAAIAQQPEALPPVEDDVLPPIGAKVLIHLASQDAWVEHTVVGYYVWPNLGPARNVFRVSVRVRDSDGYLNARCLQDIRYPEPVAKPEGAAIAQPAEPAPEQVSDSPFDQAIHQYAQAAWHHDMAGMRKGYMALQALCSPPAAQADAQPAEPGPTMADAQPVAPRDREADRARFIDPAFNRWLDEGISDAGHTVWDAVGDVQSAWSGWDNRQHYAAAPPARQPEADAQPVAPEIDYQALIQAAYTRTKAVQGTRSCTQFAKGAEWYREQVLAAAPPARQPLTLDQTRDLVKECGLDWHRGFAPLFDGDETNRYAVLVQEVERLCGIGREGE